VINGHFPERKLQILRNYPREYSRPAVFEDAYSLAFWTIVLYSLDIVC